MERNAADRPAGPAGEGYTLGDMMQPAQVRDSCFSQPINGLSGWYVWVWFRPGYHEAANAVAQVEAEKNGYDPDGSAAVGPDVRQGINTYSRAYWFYDKTKEV